MVHWSSRLTRTSNWVESPTVTAGRCAVGAGGVDRLPWREGWICRQPAETGGIPGCIGGVATNLWCIRMETARPCGISDDDHGPSDCWYQVHLERNRIAQDVDVRRIRIGLPHDRLALRTALPSASISTLTRMA